MAKSSELTSMDMVNMNYEVPDDLHHRIKVLAAVNKTTVKALVIEALERLADEMEGKK